MRLVAAVICAVAVVPAALAARPTAVLVRQAERASGLTARHSIRTATEPPALFDKQLALALGAQYPFALRTLDDRLYEGLGLLQPGETAWPRLVHATTSTNASYDAAARVLRLRSNPRPARVEILDELVRALVDQNYGLRRIGKLRARDRDAALAADGTVEGLAAAASGLRATVPSGSPVDRFLSDERGVARAAGRSFVGALRSVGGAYAVRTALRTFPRTTEQLLHVDKFLAGEPAAPVTLPTEVDDRAVSTTETLAGSETFGELDVRALLDAFNIPGAARAAAGWAGGRLALYTGADGTATVALALRWGSADDAVEWRAAASTYVAEAFPGAAAHVCPAVGGCWVVGDRELAVASSGDATVFASGAAGELVAAALVRSSP